MPTHQPRGRLATPILPALPVDLAGWHWERRDHLLRLVCNATSWATPWCDEDEPDQPIAIAGRYRRVMAFDEETMTTTELYKTHDRAETDLDDGLHERLTAAGWRWQSATRLRNGWHHLLYGQITNQRLLRVRIVELVGDVSEPWPPIDWEQLDALLARRDAGPALEAYAARHGYEVPALHVQALDRALDEARRMIAAGYADDAVMVADRFGDPALRKHAHDAIASEVAVLHQVRDEMADLLPGGTEEALRDHGWSWHAKDNRGRSGYLFHNAATYESCWYPSLESRLEADSKQPTLYGYIVEGWQVPALGDKNALYRRPTSVPEQCDVPIDAIRPGRYQPRRIFSDEELQELAESIKEHGILTRLKIFVNEWGDYELIAGERRLRAAKLVGLEHVPVEVCEYSLVQIHEISIIDNLQREGLSPVEEGFAYERLASELNISEAALARRLGKNRAYIQQRRAIGRAAPELQQALASNELTFSQVRGLCLGAADNHKAQLAALKKVREQIKTGRRISEKDAQEEAEKAILRAVEKDLEALGWSIAKGGSVPNGGVWLWSPGERPRSYTSNELLAMVQEKRRPGGTPIGGRPLTPEETNVLSIKGYHHYGGTFEPWIVLWGNDPQVLTADEVPALVERVRGEFVAMQVRYQAAGWELEHTSGNGFRATSNQKRIENPWRWDGVEELIAKIESGKIVATPEKKAPSSEPAYTWTCDGCSKTFRNTNYNWQSGKKLCNSCQKQYEAEQKARRDATAALLTNQWHAWLEQAPLDLVRILAASVTNWRTASFVGLDTRGPINLSDVTEHIVAMEQPALVEVIPQLVAHWAEDKGIRFIDQTEQETGA